MTIGAVLGEAWSLYTRFFARFFLLGLVVFAALNLVYALLVEAISSDSEGAIAALGILGFAIAVIGTVWLEGAFVYAVQDARDGSFDSKLGDIFARVSPAVLPLVVAGLLAGLGIALGFMNKGVAASREPCPDVFGCAQFEHLVLPPCYPGKSGLSSPGRATSVALVIRPPTARRDSAREAAVPSRSRNGLSGASSGSVQARNPLKPSRMSGKPGGVPGCGRRSGLRGRSSATR